MWICKSSNGKKIHTKAHGFLNDGRFGKFTTLFYSFFFPNFFLVHVPKSNWNLFLFTFTDIIVIIWCYSVCVCESQINDSDVFNKFELFETCFNVSETKREWDKFQCDNRDAVCDM